MILLETRPTAAESWVIACDVCGHALDPGALDAPDGGWDTQRAAYDAADARGWATNVLEVGRDLCPPCQAQQGNGHLPERLVDHWHSTIGRPR